MRGAVTAIIAAPMGLTLQERVYPESRFGGFTRIDGTVAFLGRVRSLLAPGQLVLDVGCGRGGRKLDPCRYRVAMQDLRGDGRRVVGIDVDDAGGTNPFIDEFRKIQDLQRWPVDDASVDVAISDFVMEHVEHPDHFLGEAHRVLKPGGVLCIRTPNRWGYVALASRMIPNRMHARVLSKVQADRDEVDVFPTFYRCNSRGRLQRAMERAGFDAAVWTTEAEPGYFAFSGLLYRVAAMAHAVMPAPLRTTLVAFGRRRA